MAFQKLYRLTALGLLISALLGFVAGYVGVPRRVMLWATLALVLFVAAGTTVYVRRLQRRGEYDERDRRIDLRSAYVTLGVIYVALIVLSIVGWFGDVSLPTVPALFGVLFGGIVVNVASTEWYRRRM